MPEIIKLSKCPVCGKVAAPSAQTEKYRPFCSKRCADVDLGRWFSESYAIPAEEQEEEGAESAQDRAVEEE